MRVIAGLVLLMGLRIALLLELTVHGITVRRSEPTSSSTGNSLNLPPPPARPAQQPLREAEAEMRCLPATRYNTVRPSLSLLGESPALGAASGGKRILEAVKRLPALARRKVEEHLAGRVRAVSTRVTRNEKRRRRNRGVPIRRRAPGRR